MSAAAIPYHEVSASTTSPLTAAREHVEDAIFYTGPYAGPDAAIAAIDQAMADLRIARAMLAARAEGGTR